jgi:hypothetical protein
VRFPKNFEIANVFSEQLASRSVRSTARETVLFSSLTLSSQQTSWRNAKNQSSANSDQRKKGAIG